MGKTVVFVLAVLCAFCAVSSADNIDLAADNVAVGDKVELVSTKIKPCAETCSQDCTNLGGCEKSSVSFSSSGVCVNDKVHVAASRSTTKFKVELKDGNDVVTKDDCVGSFDYTFTSGSQNMGSGLVYVTNLNDDGADSFTAVWTYKTGSGPDCSVSQTCTKQCKEKSPQSSSASSVAVAFGALAASLVLAF